MLLTVVLPDAVAMFGMKHRENEMLGRCGFFYMLEEWLFARKIV